MRALLTAVAVVVAALFVGCSQPISPTSPSITSSGGNATSTGIPGEVAARGLSREEVPFKGSLEGAVTSRTPLTPPLVSLLTEGTGNATHLGRFTVEIAHVVNTLARTVTGSYEFTAANGDTLIADFTGQSGPTAGEPARSLKCGNRDHHGGHRSVRRRHWEFHRRAVVEFGHLLDHCFLRGDDLLARCRQALKRDHYRQQHGVSPLPTGVLNGASAIYLTTPPPNVTSYDVILTTAGDVLIAAGVSAPRTPVPGEPGEFISHVDLTIVGGFGKYPEATGTMTFDGRVSHGHGPANRQSRSTRELCVGRMSKATTEPVGLGAGGDGAADRSSATARPDHFRASMLD